MTKNKPEGKKKLCFVIGPIGEYGTSTRNEADFVLMCIIKPALETDPFQFDVKRADEFSEPGDITTQIINTILDADLVVADLIGHNPNAFYELALRHMAEKPVIRIYKGEQKLPFDVQNYRAVPYSLLNPRNFEEAKTKLRAQMEAISKSDFKVSNPVTNARGRQQLAKSADPKDRIVADLSDRIHSLENVMERTLKLLGTFMERDRGKQALVEALMSRTPMTGISSPSTGPLASTLLGFGSTPVETEPAAVPDCLSSGNKNPKPSGDV